MFINGVILNAPIEMNYDEDRYAEAYHTLISALGYHKNYESHAITLKIYKNGMSIQAFDLSIDGSQQCKSVISEGVLRVEAFFDKQLPESLTCLIYMSFDLELQINSDRYVTVLPTINILKNCQKLTPR